MKQVLWIAMVPLLVAAGLVLLALTCGCADIKINVQQAYDNYKDQDAALVGPDIMEVGHEMAPGN